MFLGSLFVDTDVSHEPFCSTVSQSTWPQLETDYS